MTLENDLLNIRQASERTGLSEMTIRKYLGLGKPAKPSRLPNARKVSREGKETWEIPLSDLFNAGLMSSKATETATQPSAEVSQAESVAVLKAENEALKVQIALLERNLEDLREEIRFSRRAIETAEVQTRRRLFWQRPKS
jgi:multidrug resistance efflux pump